MHWMLAREVSGTSVSGGMRVGCVGVDVGVVVLLLSLS